MTWSNEYVKIPFTEKGRTRKGVDCWGLVRLIYQERKGVSLPEFTGYTDTKDHENISRLIREGSLSWQPVEKGSEAPYDVVVLKIMSDPWHVGLVVGCGWMVHSLRGSGVIHSDYMNDRAWRDRVLGFYRYANPDSLTAV